MASEVGNAQVAVFATFRGFRRSVQKEIDAAERDGSARFRKGFAKSSAAAGRDSGVGFRKGFAAATSELGKQMQADVAKASRAVSVSRLKEQDAAGKVRVAEAALADARKKHAAESVQVVRAEERLASAQRGLTTSQESTRAATDRLADAQKRLADSAGKASRAGVGFAAFRSNVSGLLAPVTALGKAVGGLASRAFTPLLRSVGAFAARVTGPMRAAVGSAVGSLRDFGLGVAMKVVTPLAKAENVIRAKFGPQLSALKAGLAPIGRAFQGAFGLAGQAVSGISAVLGPVASGIGKTFSVAMSGVKRVASDAASFVGSTFKAAGAAVAATLGIALTKGFGRLAAIDSARTKLNALGNSADDVDTLMNSALKSVKGTAFGLGEAAGTAASLAAAKVPLGLVDKALQSVASTAAVAGTGMDVMGGIFAKVAANQKLDGEVVQQLMDNQVPILSMIADHYKVTGEQAKKMVKDGKVSFADFVAITGQLGDAAKVMGTSFSGMAKNVGAALGRMGAVILGPAFDGLKQIMPGVMNVIDQVTAAITPLFKMLGEKVAPVFERIGKALSGWTFDGSGLSGLTSMLGPLLPVIGAVVGLLGGMLGRFKLLAPILGGLSAPLGLAVGAFAALMTIDPTTFFDGMMKLVDGVGPLVEKLIGGVGAVLSKLGTTLLPRLMDNLPILIQGAAGLVGGLIDGIVNALPGLLSVLIGIVPQLLDVILKAIPELLTAGALILQSLITGITTVIPMLIDAVVKLIPQLITMLVQQVPMIIQTGITLLLGLLQSIVQAVPIIIQALVDAIPVILTALLGALPLLVEAGIQLFLGLVMALAQIIPQLIETITAMLPVIIDAVVGMIPTLLLAAVDLFVQIVQAIPVVLPQLITAIVGMIPTIVNAIVGMIPKLMDAAVKLFLGILDALPIIIPKLVNALKDLGPQMVDAIVGLVPVIFDAGKKIISGLIDGVKSMFGEVGKAFGGVMDFIGGFFPHSPAKHGPLSGSGWSRIKQSGHAIIEQLSDGVDSAALTGTLSRAVSDVVGLGAITARVGITGASAAVTAGAPAVYVQNPFTGEYLLAAVDGRAAAQAAARGKTLATQIRYGRRADS